ncbi:MAG: ATP-binding cassette domain-containing protein [Chlamydiales bacterium]|nr:ATP-binding cassette domain-containing protein [Chlamydiales bacterium]
MGSISFEKVTFSFHHKAILKEVSGEIRPGEFIGIFGPNGAGKSTLLRLILGLIKPESGTLLVNSRPPETGNCDIGYMPQVRREAQMLPLSGRSYLAATLHGTGWGVPRVSKEDAEQIERVIELVGMRDYVDRPFFECSGGERQRLALAQALLGKPNILLLDEPLSNLDPHQQENIINLVQSIQRQLKITVLFTAHDINPLLHIMDRILYLGNGKMVIGAVEEVVTSEILSELYNTHIEVVHSGDNIWVMHKNTGCFNVHHPHFNDGYHTHNK